MTPTSLVPEMAGHAGYSFGAILRLDGGGRVLFALTVKKSTAKKREQFVATANADDRRVLPRPLRRFVRFNT